ncbi:hypothetical protein DKX38_019143 [Salix brachista]|uniref:Uncharacterized protein n=1 Tax=Salix brachista TaxID=2182728 RepID=A0A5N5KQ36_9ROSI|nr:hypothetical protein DKX38_019143 [Salix brachista]
MASFVYLLLFMVLTLTAQFSLCFGKTSRKELRNKEPRLETMIQSGSSIQINRVDPSRVVTAQGTKETSEGKDDDSGRTGRNRLLASSTSLLNMDRLCEDLVDAFYLCRITYFQGLKKEFQLGLSFQKCFMVLHGLYCTSENSKPLQVMHYGIEDAKNNGDYFGNKSAIVSSEPLMATLVFYLSNVTQGGEILFPKSEVKSKIWSDCTKISDSLRPIKGNAILFFTVHLNSSPDMGSSHSRCPVLEGEMWYATKTFYLRAIKVFSDSEGSECTDEDGNCSSWAALGECEKNPVYMIGSPDYYGTCKKICLLYVHRPANVVSFTHRKLSVNKLKEDAAKAFQEFKTKKMHDVLDQYRLILDQEGVEADILWIEMDDIAKGIVEVIAQGNIRWLVMGAAADKYYSKEGRDFGSETDISLPMLLLSSDSDTEQLRLLGSESHIQLDRSLGAEEVAGDLEGILGRFDYYPVHSCQPTNIILNTSKLIPLLTDEVEKLVFCSFPQLKSHEMFFSSSMILIFMAWHEEEKTQTQTTEETCSRLEQVIIDAKDSKKKVLVEAVKRWKEEDNVMEAKCKAIFLFLFFCSSFAVEAKASENLCIKEISQRKEMEEALNRRKQEVEKKKNQRDEFLKELQMVQEHKFALESQIAESQNTVEELEQKIISAVQLLISFKERRDAARVEFENAIQEVRRLDRSAKAAAAGGKSEILELSFMEINEATHYFDPSWKISEGKYGSVYKGLLRHLLVAIKMFPSYSSQSLLDFQNGVEILSRVRHPNLVMLVGTCPESRSLVYEYVRNRSLEDNLFCKDKMPPLPWQTRIRIAVQICSSLIFLHSNKPCIIHGNLKPSKVLLDANFVSKLTDFGMFYLIPQSESSSNSTGICNKSNPNFTSLYIDPEYLETGMLMPESDVYSFGIILLQLLTGSSSLDILKEVKCAIEKDNFKALLDCSGGNWPFEEAEQLANLALRCCEKNRHDRPDLELILRVLEPMKTSGIDSGPKEPSRIPSHFVCPILQEVMGDPQIAADGFTYEAEAIRGWLQSGHSTSPMTNLKLEHCNLLPNHALHRAILGWRQYL